MFATLNFQLPDTISPRPDSGTPRGTAPLTIQVDIPPTVDFAQQLSAQSYAVSEITVPGGEWLPEGGNPLPVSALDIELPSVAEDHAVVTLLPPNPDLPETPLVASLQVLVADAGEPVVDALSPRVGLQLELTSGPPQVDGAQRATSHPVAFRADQPLPTGTLPVTSATNTADSAPALTESIRLTEDGLPVPAPALNRSVALRSTTGRELPAANLRGVDRVVTSPAAPATDKPEPVPPDAIQRVAQTTNANAISDRIQAAIVQAAPSQAQTFTLGSTPVNASFQAIDASSELLQQTIRTPVSDSGWGDHIGEQLLLMSRNKTQQAELRLTPAEMGPLRVRIAIEDGAASVNFQAPHAVTREALEVAMPRLRELLAENGLTLGQADVSDDGVAERRDGRSETGSDDDLPDSVAEAADEPAQQRRPIVTRDGLVDTFV